MVIEVIRAFGHENITAKHKTTFEITKDPEIAKKADCIIAVSAEKGASDLSRQFKNVASRPDALIVVDLWASGVHERIIGCGHPDLRFLDPKDLVGRTSSYICARTLMIRTDKAAFHLNREFVKKIQHRDTLIKIRLTARSGASR
ncbi:MAG: DUF371 domain-containing protein [Methanocellales archaeon]|nr:DUF371 domain-containing protein [Methanocellales archaeon]